MVDDEAVGHAAQCGGRGQPLLEAGRGSHDHEPLRPALVQPLPDQLVSCRARAGCEVVGEYREIACDAASYLSISEELDDRIASADETRKSQLSHQASLLGPCSSGTAGRHESAGKSISYHTTRPSDRLHRLGVSTALCFTADPGSHVTSGNARYWCGLRLFSAPEWNEPLEARPRPFRRPHGHPLPLGL